MRTHVDNDRYEILNFIASGGQAEVYQARDTRLTQGDRAVTQWGKDPLVRPKPYQQQIRDDIDK